MQKPGKNRRKLLAVSCVVVSVGGIGGLIYTVGGRQLGVISEGGPSELSSGENLWQGTGNSRQGRSTRQSIIGLQDRQGKIGSDDVVSKNEARRPTSLDKLKERWAQDGEVNRFSREARLTDEQKRKLVDVLAFWEHQSASLRRVKAEPERLVAQLTKHSRAVVLSKLDEGQAQLFVESDLLKSPGG